MKRNLLFVFAGVLACAIFMMAFTFADDKSPAGVITLQIGNPTMTVDGVEQPIDGDGTSPVIQGGRTLLPIRAVIEAMGGAVEWDEATQTVTLTQKSEVVKNGGVTEQIANSYSARAFMEKEVSGSDIETILKSGAKAPSARNTQPWHFTVVTNEALVTAIARGTLPGCAAIVVSGKTEEMVGINVDFDAALATQNMYMTAQDLGLGARIYTGPVQDINENKREELAIPEGYDVISVIAVGYVENIADAISGASPRNSLDDIVNYVE